MYHTVFSLVVSCVILRFPKLIRSFLDFCCGTNIKRKNKDDGFYKVTDEDSGHKHLKLKASLKFRNDLHQLKDHAHVHLPLYRSICKNRSDLLPN